jgi:hypothetical protein
LFIGAHLEADWEERKMDQPEMERRSFLKRLAQWGAVGLALIIPNTWLTPRAEAHIVEIDPAQGGSQTKGCSCSCRKDDSSSGVHSRVHASLMG